MESPKKGVQKEKDMALESPTSPPRFNATLTAHRTPQNAGPSCLDATKQREDDGSTTVAGPSIDGQFPWLLTTPVKFDYPVEAQAPQPFGLTKTERLATEDLNSFPHFRYTPGQAMSYSPELPSTVAEGKRPATKLSLVEATTTLPGVSSLFDSQHSETEDAGAWLERHHACLISSAHRHHSNGGITFRTFEDFLRTRHDLRDVPTPLIADVPRESARDITQQVTVQPTQETDPVSLVSPSYNLGPSAHHPPTSGNTAFAPPSTQGQMPRAPLALLPHAGATRAACNSMGRNQSAPDPSQLWDVSSILVDLARAKRFDQVPAMAGEENSNPRTTDPTRFASDFLSE